MDYCNTILAGAPRTVTDKLQRVLNAAARVITGARKFDRGLRQILNDVPDRVLFELAVTVHQCLNGRAPPYLSEHCIPVSSADMRRHLCSANRHLVLLAVPYFRLNTRPSGVLCCWPDDLELSRIFFSGREFQAILAEVAFSRLPPRWCGTVYHAALAHHSSALPDGFRSHLKTELQSSFHTVTPSAGVSSA